MWKVIQRLKFAFCAIPFLLSAGCTKSIEEKEEATSAPTPTATAVTEYVASGPVSTPEPLPTATPMDASFITPSPTSTPVQIYIPTEEEEKFIDNTAKEYFKLLTDFYKDGYPLTEESLGKMIRSFRGEFVSFYDYELDNYNPDKVEAAKKHYFNDMFSFMNQYYYSFSTELLAHLRDNTKNKPSVFNLSGFVNILENDSDAYMGVDLLKANEELYQKLYEEIDGDWESFEEKALLYQQFVESFYLNNDQEIEYNGGKLTSYNNCDPRIKMMLLLEAWTYLNSTAIVEYCENKTISGELTYSTITLEKKLLELFSLDGELFKEISSVMDAYLSITSQGVYDAYLTGNATRKEIIKQLCIEKESNLY